MKTVLIATDFSDAANNATLYGLEFAKAFHASVVLVSAYEQVPVPVNEIPVLVTLEDMYINVQRQLADTARMLENRYGMAVETCCKEGSTMQAITEAIAAYRADLVIVGLKKTKYHFRRLLGGNVTAMVRKMPVPIIVVPEEIKYTSVTTIALANESSMAATADWHILDALKEIAQCFHSKLYMVRIEHNHFRESFEICNYPFQMNRMLSLDPIFDCIESKDVSRALTDFVEAYHINMLAMLPHKHSLLEKWFIDDTTRTTVFEAPIPLLILPDVTVNKAKPKRSKKAMHA